MTNIVTDLEQLSIRADEVDVRKENNDTRNIVIKLKEVIRENNLTSLTAPQIGIDRRIFVINFNGDMRTFINPVMTEVKGFELSREICSSIPDKTYIRPRHNEVTAMYQTPLGKIESKKFLGASARVFQHCIDHLDGLLLPDVGLEIDEMFDTATEEERLQVINMYLDSLDIKQKDIEKEIAEDKDLKEISDAVNFMESVEKGEIQVEQVPIEKEQEPEEKENE